jgi:hypothetical protein
MDSAPYNNRELDAKFATVLDKLDSLGKDLEHHRQHLHERMDEFEAGATIKLDDIKTQTTKTNGRVSTIERWQAYVLGSTDGAPRADRHLHGEQDTGVGLALHVRIGSSPRVIGCGGNVLWSTTRASLPSCCSYQGLRARSGLHWSAHLAVTHIMGPSDRRNSLSLEDLYDFLPVFDPQFSTPRL